MRPLRPFQPPAIGMLCALGLLLVSGITQRVEGQQSRSDLENRTRDMTGTFGGNQFLFDADITTVADMDKVCGVAEPYATRNYHAFPSLIRVEDQLIGSWMTATSVPGGHGGHLSKRGDMVIAKSDLTGRNWTEIYRFRCSKPNHADALAIGDRSYYYGGLVHLGGQVLGIALDTYTMVDTGNIHDITGYRGRWAISHDLGKTWSEPAPFPFHAGGTHHSVAAGEPVVWQGQCWVTFYGNAGVTVARAAVGDLVAGNTPWITGIITTSGGTEACFLGPVKSDDDTLRVVIRHNEAVGMKVFKIAAAQAASPPSEWTWEIASWLPPKWSQTQPQVWRTESGRYLHVGRGNADGDTSGAIDLVMRVCYAESLGGPWQRVNGADDSPIIGVRRADYPAADDLEKHMYNGFVPLGGDLFGILISTDAAEHGTSNNKNPKYPMPTRAGVGTRSSVWFTHIGAGVGKTTRGDFKGSRAVPPAVPKNLGDMTGLKLMLLASNAESDGSNGLNLKCPISGLRWITPPGQSLALLPTGSSTGKPALENTGGSGKRLVFDGAEATLQTLNTAAIYIACSHATGSGAGQAVVVNTLQIDDTNHWRRIHPLSHNHSWKGLLPGAETDSITAGWQVYALRVKSGATDAAGRLFNLMNQSGRNCGWNGRLAAVLVFDRDLSQREHKELVERLSAL